MSHEPIQTTYAGYRFRSRLEARWAVFLDALGFKWQYESQGFNTLAGPYLPDFELDQLGCFLEVKPDAPSDTTHDLARAFSLVSTTAKPLFYLIGAPGPWSRPPVRWMEFDDVKCIGLYRKQWTDPALDDLAARLHHKIKADGGILECRQAICEMSRIPTDERLPQVWHAPDATIEWIECASCGRVGLGPPGGQAARAFCRCDVPRWVPDGERLMRAYQKARSARFEHDERWRP